MNILFFQDTLGVSGGEIWIADAATKLRARGHSISIGCPSGSWMEHQAEARRIPYFDYMIEEEFESNLRWQLAEHLYENEIDLICCGIPGVRPEAPLLDAAVREAGGGSILLRLGVSPGPGALSAERIGLHLDTVQGIVVVSKDIKSHLLKEFPSLSPDQVHVLYNGVDLQRFNPTAFSPTDRKQVRDALDIPHTHTVIGAVGRLDAIKNLPTLIQASRSVLARFPDTTFLIVGDGTQKQALIEAAEEAGVLDSFRFAGFVENIPRLLYGIDVLVHTALSEGLPNAILEAMAMEKPIVATHVGGVPELIEKGKSGILIPPSHVQKLSEELCTLLRYPAHRATFGRAARRRAEAAFNRRAKLDELEGLFISEARKAEPVGALQPAGAVELQSLSSVFFERSCALQRVHP